MSMREQDPPDFSNALRGYDRAQVDEYLASFREYTIQVEDRATAAESALAQCRRELAFSPGTVGISQRLDAVLQLANEEAGEIRARAQADSETTTQQAESRAEHTINDANQQREAIQREIDDLAAVREELLQRLIELGGQIVEATERYQGYPPGASPPATAEVKLFDAEAVDNEPAVHAEPVVDPDADTQGLTSTGQTPEHQ
jgi:cell division septum initiation protein DivIVA